MKRASRDRRSFLFLMIRQPDGAESQSERVGRQGESNRGGESISDRERERMRKIDGEEEKWRGSEADSNTRSEENILWLDGLLQHSSFQVENEWARINNFSTASPPLISSFLKVLRYVFVVFENRCLRLRSPAPRQPRNKTRTTETTRILTGPRKRVFR